MTLHHSRSPNSLVRRALSRGFAGLGEFAITWHSPWGKLLHMLSDLAGSGDPKISRMLVDVLQSPT